MNGTQLRAMLWLRWRLTHNQWRRGAQLSALIMIVVSLFGLTLAVVGGVVGVVVGWVAPVAPTPEESMYIWDMLVCFFLFFWTIGLVTDLQRSEMLDLGRFLILPISLKDVFLLNYLASHFSLSLATMLPLMLGLAVGLALGHDAAFLLLVPAVVGFFFMVTAWTYCLRGWLAALMVNKRRRRTIVIVITTVFVLMFQLPNLISNFWLRDRHTAPPKNPAEVQQQAEHFEEKKAEAVAALDVANRVVPLLWLPEAARGLADGRPWPAIFGALGMLAIGGWGLARAYRGTIRFYRGADTARRPAPSNPAVPPGRPVVPAGQENQEATAPPAAARAGKTFLERSLPPLPEAAAAMALASFRSMTRAPEVKMALVTNVLIFTFLGISSFFRGTGSMPAGVRPIFGSIAVAVSMMGLAQLMFNQFGFDRNGFRSLVLLPTPRRHILLGKNVALVPAAASVFAVYLVLVSVFVHLGVLDVLATGLEFVTALLLMSVLGNLLSIVVPYRVAAGSMKPTKTAGTTKLLIFVTHLLFPLALAPVFVPALLGILSGELGWLPGWLVTLAGSAVAVGLAGVVYWRTLGPLARLLERREQRILEAVTYEVE